MEGSFKVDGLGLNGSGGGSYSTCSIGEWSSMRMTLPPITSEGSRVTPAACA
jgi:hypothetical protein